MQLIDDNNKVHPIFFNSFVVSAYKENEDQRFLKFINSYYYKINGEEYLPFESELELLFSLIQEFQTANDDLKSKINLFKCLITFYTGMEDLSQKFYKETNPNVFDDDSMFSKIYSIIGKALDAKAPKELPNSKIIISGNIDHDLLHFQRFYLKQLKYPGLNVDSSQNYPDVSLIFENCLYIFFVGHGNDNNNEGLNYYYSWKDAFRLRSETLKSLATDVEVLGLLSCASEPYADILGVSKYFIIPDTAFSEYAEMFIKGFYLKWQEFGDIEFNIQLGLIALLLRSNKTLVFNVYKDGQPFKI